MWFGTDTDDLSVWHCHRYCYYSNFLLSVSIKILISAFMLRSKQGRSDLNKHSIIKIAIKHFLKTFQDCSKTMTFRRWLNVINNSKKNICKMQSIENKITVDDKNLYHKKRRIVIKQKLGTYGVRLDISRFPLC